MTHIITRQAIYSITLKYHFTMTAPIASMKYIFHQYRKCVQVQLNRRYIKNTINIMSVIFWKILLLRILVM